MNRFLRARIDVRYVQVRFVGEVPSLYHKEVSSGSVSGVMTVRMAASMVVRASRSSLVTASARSTVARVALTSSKELFICRGTKPA